MKLLNPYVQNPLKLYPAAAYSGCKFGWTFGTTPPGKTGLPLPSTQSGFCTYFWNADPYGAALMSRDVTRWRESEPTYDTIERDARNQSHAERPKLKLYTVGTLPSRDAPSTLLSAAFPNEDCRVGRSVILPDPTVAV